MWPGGQAFTGVSTELQLCEERCFSIEKECLVIKMAIHVIRTVCQGSIGLCTANTFAVGRGRSVVGLASDIEGAMPKYAIR